MKKLLKRSNNKGFSLIELVIVIAIMAALIAILAPQYLKYVEKSRKTADETVANEILSAAKVASTDPDDTAFTGLEVTWAAAGGVSATGDADAVKAVGFALDSSYTGAAAWGGMTITRKSSAHKTGDFVVTITDAGVLTADSITGTW